MLHVLLASTRQLQAMAGALRELPTTLDVVVHRLALAMLDIQAVMMELQQQLSGTGRWTKAQAQSRKMSPVLGVMPR